MALNNRITAPMRAALAALAAVGAFAAPVAARAETADAIPYRPIPPAGADYRMAIPPLGPDGARMTLNKNLTAEQILWHVRSGWNVAALNCRDAQYQPILDGYKAFLKTYSRKLAATNAALDGQYHTVAMRERAATQLYNYFALPTAREGFCDASLAIATEFLAAPPSDAAGFAAAALPRLDAPFEQFFGDYEQYQRDSADWDAKYGLEYGYSQPGYVAVHGGAGLSVAVAITTQSLAVVPGN